MAHLSLGKLLGVFSCLADEEAAQLLQKAHESRSLLQAELYFERGEIEAARTALSILVELNPAQTAGGVSLPASAW